MATVDLDNSTESDDSSPSSLSSLESSLSALPAVNQVNNVNESLCLDLPKLLRKYETLTTIMVNGSLSEEEIKLIALNKAGEEIAQLCLDGTVPYPLMRIIGGDPRDYFDRLVNYQPCITKDQRFHLHSYNGSLYWPPVFRGRSTLISTNKGDFLINGVTDFFIEQERIKARRFDTEKSVAESWTDLPELKKMAHNILTQGNYTVLRLPELRSAIWHTFREVKTFDVTWAKSLLLEVLTNNDRDFYTSVANYHQNMATVNVNPLQGLKVGDISAGWGDRCLAAMALGMDYIGFDPNTNLKAGHDQMIAMFGSSDRHRIIYEPFEDNHHLTSDSSIDVFLTSPPFHDVEIYTEDDRQSLTRYPQVEVWLVKFMFRSLAKAWAALKQGGYLILHLNDGKNMDICEPTNLFIESMLAGSSWEGVIAIQGSNKFARPVWVWKKLHPSVRKNTIRSRYQGIRTLASIYPALYTSYMNLNKS